MGSLMLLTCGRCQYCEDVAVGSGMDGAMKDLVLCAECSRVVDVEVPEPVDLCDFTGRQGGSQVLRCPSCRGSVKPWGTDPESVQDAPTGPCPKCAGVTR